MAVPATALLMYSGSATAMNGVVESGQHVMRSFGDSSPQAYRLNEHLVSFFIVMDGE